MENYQIVAALRLASRQDIFKDQIPYENKKLFLKDPETQMFHGIYVIPEMNITDRPSYHPAYADSLLRQLDRHTIIELLSGLHNKEFYVLDEKQSLSYFNFKLNIRTAADYDLLDGPKSIKQNVVYYVKLSSGEIQGPHTMGVSSRCDHIKKAIADGKLFVPSAQQTFEEIKIAKAS